MNRPKINIKNILVALLWCTIGVGGIVLLVAAVRSKNVKTCRGVEIEISGVSNNFFIDQADVLSIIKNFVGGKPEGRIISAFNLRDIEQNLEQDVWIKNAELFFDNNEILRVNVNEREPVARIFSGDGESFYIDSSLKILPLSQKFSARLPVFTGFNHRPAYLSKADSSLLSDIMKMSIMMQADSFIMAMIEQVDITPQRSFEMMPKIGTQLIVFGDAADAAEKFNKLKLFYKQVITNAGWSRYSVINLQYKNQVVAKIKDAIDKSSDSLRALQIMQFIAERAARQAADSVQTFMQDTDKNSADSSLIQQSIQRDEPEQTSSPIEKENAAAPVAATVTAPVPDKKPEPIKPSTVKPTTVKPATVKSTTVKPAPLKIIKPVAVKIIAAPKKTTAAIPKAVMKKPE